MCLSENIKNFRLKKDLTQEQLASRLGVSAQAVSKWERSETYPDRALLVSLSRELGASLDELFENNYVSMPDISRRIIALLQSTEPDLRFATARDICWQIERGFIGYLAELESCYDPKINGKCSYVVNDSGFTMISNGCEPFFALFPQPDAGYGYFLDNRQELQDIFAALSRPDTFNALIWLYKRPRDYIFESAVLAGDCGIDNEQIDRVTDDLILLRVLLKQELIINGQKRILFYTTPRHNLIALLLIANTIGYKGGYCLTVGNRNEPFIK